MREVSGVVGGVIPLGFTPHIESLKYCGLAIMLIVHFFDYVPQYHSAFLYGFGSIGLPLFVFALAFALEGKPVEQYPRLLLKLFAFAVLAQVASLTVRDGSILNVLFTLGVGIYAYWFYASTRVEWFHGFMLPAALVVGINSEFSLVGVALVFVALCWVRERNTNWLIAGLVLLALLTPYNGNIPAAFLALPVVWLVGRLPRDIPRVRGLFYWLYVGQFPIFWVARSVVL